MHGHFVLHAGFRAVGDVQRRHTDTIVGVHGKHNGYVVCDVSKDEFRVAMVEIDAKRDPIGDKPGDVHRYVVHAGKHTPEVA